MRPKRPVRNAALQQQVVETVDIQGNRRLRDDDLLYYIKTRPGDTYDPAALERDLKELLSLNFFDKTATRVLTDEGVRGGVNVIFEVRELPIVRDLQFTGSKPLQESDVLKAFREKRVGISKEAVYDPVKARNATAYPARNACHERLSERKGRRSRKKKFRQPPSPSPSTSIKATARASSISILRAIEHFKDSELRNALDATLKRPDSSRVSRARTSSTCVKLRLRSAEERPCVYVVERLLSGTHRRARGRRPRAKTHRLLPLMTLSAAAHVVKGRHAEDHRPGHRRQASFASAS